MATEIEARFLEVDVPAIVRRLHELGAEDRGETLLKETIYYDQDLAWQRSGRTLVRVRESQEGIAVSYKNTTSDTVVGTEEHEFTVDDPRAVEDFLAHIGLVAYRRQEKRRHAFRLNGVHVDLDSWPRVPTYVEIEGPTETAVQGTAAALGLDWAKAVFGNAGLTIEQYYHLPARRLRWFTFDRVEVAEPMDNSRAKSMLPREIRTSRLILRAPRPEDADVIFQRYAQDAEVTRFLTWRPHLSIDETRDFVQRCLDGWQRGTPLTWSITRIDEDLALGMVDLRIDHEGAEMGYVLARAEWGKGYMTEAVGAVVEQVLALPHVYRVAAICDVENVASARVMEKVGMLREGILRRAVLHPNISAEPRDAYVYARTR
jgi:predicted adenylyl cyclase CyaB